MNYFQQPLLDNAMGIPTHEHGIGMQNESERDIYKKFV